MHYCAYHKIDESEDRFRTKPNGKLDSWCVEGRREYGRNYSRKAYAPRKEEVAQRRSEPVIERACIDCKATKPIEQFPERGDRPGKRHGRCLLCFKLISSQRSKAYNIENFAVLAEYKRKYHAANPGYNEQSSRRRRARHVGVRREKYTRDDVRLRDPLCHFCGDTIDTELRWPDPWSEVLHHIHPISKKGPDALANVALAHNRCNGRHKDRHENPFADWRVEPIGSYLARDIAKREHYLHRAPSVSLAYGLFAPSDDLPVGIVTFGTPSSHRISKSVCPAEPKLVIELNRLWISSGVPFGAASWFVSRALKAMPGYIVVSYADTSVQDPRNNRSHDGSVYRALSLSYAGRTRARKEWRMPGKSRNVGKVPGAVLSDVSSKHRFWTVTGDKRERRALRSLCAWPSLAYDV